MSRLSWCLTADHLFEYVYFAQGCLQFSAFDATRVQECLAHVCACEWLDRTRGGVPMVLNGERVDRVLMMASMSSMSPMSPMSP